MEWDDLFGVLECCFVSGKLGSWTETCPILNKRQRCGSVLSATLPIHATPLFDQAGTPRDHSSAQWCRFRRGSKLQDCGRHDVVGWPTAPIKQVWPIRSPVDNFTRGWWIAVGLVCVWAVFGSTNQLLCVGQSHLESAHSFWHGFRFILAAIDDLAWVAKYAFLRVQLHYYLVISSCLLSKSFIKIVPSPGLSWKQRSSSSRN